MVEMEVHDSAPVAANGAGSASLLNKNPLHFLQAPGDRFPNTALAAPAAARLAARVQGEFSLPMALAETHLHRTPPRQ